VTAGRSRKMKAIIFKIQKILFYILSLTIAALLAWISIDRNIQIDFTQQQHSQLTQESIDILQQITDPVHIQSFSSPQPLIRKQTLEILNKFAKYKDNFTFEFINPELSPDIARKYKIEQDGEMIVNFNNKQTILSFISEKTITNSLLSMNRQQKIWLGYVAGHGERSPYSKAKNDLSILNKKLKSQGLYAISLNLDNITKIPENLSLLIIASPTKAFSLKAQTILKQYINQGKNKDGTF